MYDDIKVNYVGENCYSLELGEYLLVFDYCNGILNVPDDKKTIFFATSNRDGHYTQEILKLFNMDNFSYVLSSDIAYDRGEGNVIYLNNEGLSVENLKDLYKKKNVIFVNSSESYRINKDIEILSFSYRGSGLSFIVKIFDFSIFYTGESIFFDKGEESIDLINYLYGIFEEEGEIDLGFFPIRTDGGEESFSYPKSFIEIFDPQIFFPLNIDEDFEMSKDFAGSFSDNPTDVRSIEEDNQEFEIDMDDWE